MTQTALHPTKAALEAAVLNLTDEQIARALTERALGRIDEDVAEAFAARAAYTWRTEAVRNLLAALARRAATGRVIPKG